MKTQLPIRRFGAAPLALMVLAAFCLPGLTHTAAAAASSLNVAVVPSFLGAGGAGFLDPNDFPDYAFTEVPPSAVNSLADLEDFDTVVLWQFCDVANHSVFVTALVAWVQGGGKLLIWDSDSCNGTSAADYTWLGDLGAAFTLSTAGANGIRDGALTIVRENKLSSTDPASPYYIDTATLVDSVDAVGDANVMTDQSGVWCADMEAENARCDEDPGEQGPVHAYTEPGKLTGSLGGWIVYCGLDYTGAGSGIPSAGRDSLVQVLELELEHGWGPPGLETVDLCGTELVLTLDPETDTNRVNEPHTVTAVFTQNGYPAEGVEVVFSIVSGPNAGEMGTGLTDELGQATFTYTSEDPGTDRLQATATQPVTGATVTSREVTKEWIPLPEQLSLSPLTKANPLGRPHLLTAVFTQDGVPTAGVEVTFTVVDGPNLGTTGTDVTDQDGEAEYSYTSEQPGIDTIQATAHHPVTGELVTSRKVTKEWFIPVPVLSLTPLTDTNMLGESHRVIAVFMEDSRPIPGVEVTFTVISGPHLNTSGSNATNADGEAEFTYQGTVAGIDHIQATAVQPLTNDEITSNEVTKEWLGPYVMIGVNDVTQFYGVDQLVRFSDLASGVGTPIGFFGDNFRNDEAIAVQPSTQDIFAVDDDRLLLVDPTDGNGTLIGSVGRSDVDGIAFHPQTGVLYGVTYGANQLLRIDLAPVASHVVASSFLVSHRLEDIAFHPDGRCFVLTSRAIFQVNPTTGAKIKRWDLTGSSQSMEALVWSPEGTTLFSAADHGLGNKDLVTITLGSSTAVAQFVDPSRHSGFVDIEGLAFLASRIQPLMVWPERIHVDAAPGAFRRQLLQNQPNPFNPSTTVHVVTPAEGHATLGVYDVSGRLVRTLFQGNLAVGPHRFEWDGHDAYGARVVSGVYFCRLRVAGREQSIHMVLAK